ncbi:LacI family DNA-binding transcriptional regulator [Lacticaseibacillus parakribbianus]|uniref:LacI family DNA-binding transcriptional regulator n=1 Tax=Lacticaseibacillus parakribbianus TaxID=2970927 RepID=UPI0021CAFE35|nr:LacI family DNA-binding transcriptional regulator [Lacticaseibacillus parakribbianus]
MTPHITIKEIAKLAGTSVSTVSRVLNNSPSVSPAKRARIQAIIDDNHFAPNMLARGMVSKTTKTLAVVVSDIGNPYFTDLVSQIEQITRGFGYTLILVNTMTAGGTKSANSTQIEVAAFASIAERQVDGVLILGGEIDSESVSQSYLEALNRLNAKTPIVIIGQKVAGCDAHFVERDQARSVALITQHLLALGNRRIAFIGGEPGIRVTTQRLAAFRTTMATYAQVDEALIVLNDYYPQSGYDAMRQLLTSGQALPDAVVAINDRVAWGAMRCLADHDLAVPNDIAVGSCDSFPNGEFMVPRITTVDQHNERLGRIAIDQLFALIDHKQPAAAAETHLPELIIRESCGAQLKAQH